MFGYIGPTCRECSNLMGNGDDYANDRCKTCMRAWRRQGGYSRAKRANKCKQKPAKWKRWVDK